MTVWGLLQRRFRRREVGWRGYAMAVLLAIFAVAAVAGLERLTIEPFSNIASIMIIAVLVSAGLFGIGPALLTAVVCSVLYDRLLVPPLISATAGFDNLIKFSVFVTAALLTGAIAGLAKRHAVALAEREAELTEALRTQETLRREHRREAMRREGEELRRAVLSAVAHDLKTPLTGIIGSMSSLQLADARLSSADRADLIDSMLSEAHRLRDYMSSILELSRFADVVAAAGLVSADDVVDLSVKRMASRLLPFDLRIDVDETLAFQGDEQLMDIALGNLLDNAIKHSPPGSAITIRTRVGTRGDFAIVVEDDGTGVAPDIAERALAERDTASDERSGSGLGLWIARRIVEAHGGRIALEMPTSGIGTHAALYLPRATVAAVTDGRQ